MRELEKEIQKDLNDDVAYHGGDVTVLKLVERYVSIKQHTARHNTVVGYNTVINLLNKEEFGNKRIDQVKVRYTRYRDFEAIEKTLKPREKNKIYQEKRRYEKYGKNIIHLPRQYLSFTYV